MRTAPRKFVVLTTTDRNVSSQGLCPAQELESFDASDLRPATTLENESAIAAELCMRTRKSEGQPRAKRTLPMHR